MSWDVLVCAAKEPPPPYSEMDDWQGEPLGTRDEVRSRISAELPEVDWADPAGGVHEGDGFSYEFRLGSDEPCQDFMVHVRGDGDAVAPLLRLIERWGWYLFDLSESEWLHHCSEADLGWKGFQAYRDRVRGR
ncbi:hypothetical protein BH23PLA1_BH23PLA1_20340 [soil metagenome]